MASAAASVIPISVYLPTTYPLRDMLLRHFGEQGYGVFDETTLTDLNAIFTFNTCKRKIGDAYLRKSLRDANFIFFVKTSDSADGFVTINYNPEEKNLYIATICSVGSIKGVGVALLEAVQKVGEHLGIDYISLEALPEKPLTNFYKKRGYKFLPRGHKFLFPMEKNLTGKREYNESLLFNNMPYIRPSVNSMWMPKVSKNTKTAEYGMFVRYSSRMDNLIDLFPRVRSLGVNVSFNSDFRIVRGTEPAEYDILEIIERRAYPEQLQEKVVEKIRKEARADFIFYTYEKDGNPSQLQNFAFVTQVEDAFIVSILYGEIETQLNEFIEKLTNSINKLSPGSYLKFKSDSIFVTYAYPGDILNFLERSHYEIEKVLPPVKRPPSTRNKVWIGGTRKRNRRSNRRSTRRG